MSFATKKSISKALEQPDLGDFTSNVQTLIEKVQFLQQTLGDCTLFEKVHPLTMQSNLALDNILEKDIPSMIESFCSMSPSWRNSAVIVEKNGQNLNAKQLLLENLNLLTNQVHAIETDLNQKLTFPLKVQNKYLTSQLFPQAPTDILLPPNVELRRQPTTIAPIEPSNNKEPMQELFQDSYEQSYWNTGGGIALMLCVFTAGLLFFILALCLRDLY